MCSTLGLHACEEEVKRDPSVLHAYAGSGRRVVQHLAENSVHHVLVLTSG